MPDLHPIPLVEVTRGESVESVHYGSFAIAFGETGQTITLGDRATPFFLRSSAKPFQLLAFLERGGADAFELTPKEIAIMCASHSGTDLHVEALTQLHQKLGLSEALLQCGTHLPYDRATAARMLQSGQTPRPYQSDCSGKHTGMLAFAKMIGAPLENYLDLTHPVQKHIVRAFTAMCEISADALRFGVDGCSAPVFAIPLPNAARGYANLCQPDRLPQKRAAACDLITHSMAAHPEMVAGPDRFDTDFMRAAGGSAISKIGTEGYQAVGVFPQSNPLGNGSIGITIKIADGDNTQRAGSVVAITILEHLGVFKRQQTENLKRYTTRPLLNWRGDEIGEIRPSDLLRKKLDDLLQ